MTRTSLANPRRTTLASLKAGTKCELSGPDCSGDATTLVATAEGNRHACSACAPR